MNNDKKIKLIKVIADVQKEIEECIHIRDKEQYGLSKYGKGKLDMAEEVLGLLLDII